MEKDYLSLLYGTRSSEFIEGYLAAMDMYAVWNGGRRFIGVRQAPLRQAMEKVVATLSENKQEDRKLIDKFF